jgi:hypothetical protein
MEYKQINEYVKTYINGNISYASRALTRMSKSDMISFIEILGSEYLAGDYRKALITTRNILSG